MRKNRKNFCRVCCSLIIFALIVITLAGIVNTAADDEKAMKQIIENFSPEIVLTEPEVSDSVKSGSIRNWGSLITIPSNREIAEFNKTSANRATCLTGWLEIGTETKYVGYSIDFKADYLPYGTYFCCANMWMDLSPLKQKYEEVYLSSGPSFYAGVQVRDPEQGGCSIMSFWDIYCKDKLGEVTTIHAKLVYPEDKVENVFNHEGNGVNYLNDYAWEKGCWYRMLLQCIRSEENNHTLVEQWICNLETGEWTKICCYDTGVTGTCFVGDAAVFLENYLIEYAGDIRTIEFKNIQICPIAGEKWVPINQVSMRSGEEPGSFCFGADSEQFWMISTGIENRCNQLFEDMYPCHVTSKLSDSPY